MKHSNREIVKLKLTNKNKSGTLMKNQIKLIGIDIFGEEHYLKFVSYDLANDLIHQSTGSELEVDIKLSSKANPWVNNMNSGLKTQAKIKAQSDMDELERTRKLKLAQMNGNVGPYD